MACVKLVKNITIVPRFSGTELCLLPYDFLTATAAVLFDFARDHNRIGPYVLQLDNCFIYKIISPTALANAHMSEDDFSAHNVSMPRVATKKTGQGVETK